MISSAVFLCLMEEVTFENALVNSHALQVVSFVLKKLIERKMKTNADACGLAGQCSKWLFRNLPRLFICVLKKTQKRNRDSSRQKHMARCFLKVKL